MRKRSPRVIDAVVYNNAPRDLRPEARSHAPKQGACHDLRGEMSKPPTLPPRTLDDILQRADEFAAREPAKAVVSAFGAGFLLNLLPLGAIAAALVRIAFSLIRPVLLFLGLLKACECCRTTKTNR